MVSSIFLLFVAIGIALASVVIGAGGVFPVLAVLGAAIVFIHAFNSQQSETTSTNE